MAIAGLLRLIEPHHEKTMLFPTNSGTKRPVLSQKTTRRLDLSFKKKRGCAIRVAKTNALISFAVIAKLIFVFVFAYA